MCNLSTDACACNFWRVAVSALRLRYAVTDTNVLETPDGLKYFAPARHSAWLGLLRAHAELTRSLEAELHAAHGIGLSAYEMLSRLAHCGDGHMRMSDLAQATSLSLSRISRLMDQLVDRGLVSRRPCAEDSRIVHATIEPAGRELVRAAQETFFAVVDQRFFGRLGCEEVQQLGALLERLVARASEASC